MERKKTFNGMAEVMDKTVFLNQFAMSNVLKDVTSIVYNKPIVIRLKHFDSKLREQHCGGGVFYEVFLDKLADLSLFAKAKDQTLTYYGFEEEELKNLVRALRGKAIDRIVPVG